MVFGWSLMKHFIVLKQPKHIRVLRDYFYLWIAQPQKYDYREAGAKKVFLRVCDGVRLNGGIAEVKAENSFESHKKHQIVLKNFFLPQFTLWRQFEKVLLPLHPLNPSIDSSPFSHQEQQQVLLSSSHHHRDRRRREKIFFQLF